MMVSMTATWENAYETLQPPVIILTGTDDKIVDMDKQSMRLHRAIPHSKLRVLPGMGHMLHYFETDQVVETIKAIGGSSATATATLG